MENGGDNMFNDNNHHNNNSNNFAWENTWALSNHSRFDLGNGSSSLYTTSNTAETTTNSTHSSEGNIAAHAFLFPHSHHHHQSLYGGDGSNLHPDPHLMCLKLGKRHYFEDTTQLGERHVAAGGGGGGGGGFSMVKKGKPYYTFAGGGGMGSSSSSSPVLVTSTATVPRCQVEGCLVALINAKDYHRRHKVCEMHSKAPKVMVLGLEQRFCQQCSRFHMVSEFDDSKRSCRRRLAGHNERRRKSSHDSLSRNSSQVSRLMSGRIPSPTGCASALSLLSSSSKADSWVSSSDLSSRCSAALRELIAENRAAILARHLILDGRDWHLQYNANEDHGEPQMAGSDSMTSNHRHQLLTDQQHNWGRYHESNTHVTLDLMQAPSEELRFLSMREKTKAEEEEQEEQEEEECSELWSSLEGDHVV